MKLNLKTLEAKRLEILSKIEGYETKLTNTLKCEIILNTRMRTTSGRAYYFKNNINLNKRLLQRNPDHIEQTFAHELAHLASYELFGNKGTGHGHYWKMTMKKFGYNPTRCHDLDATGLSTKHKVVAYASCRCCDRIEIKAKRYYYMVELGRRYKCSGCNARILLHSELRQ